MKEEKSFFGPRVYISIDLNNAEKKIMPKLLNTVDS